MVYLPVSAIAVSEAPLSAGCGTISARASPVADPPSPPLPSLRQAIFALPVFDFQARWLDIYGRIADSDKTMVSFYLWYYIIVSFVLTLITIEAWWVFANESLQPWWRRSLFCIVVFWPVSRLRDKCSSGFRSRPQDGCLGCV